MSFRSAQIDELEGGHTALHVACHQGHCEIIRELLERGANIDVQVSSHNFLIITVIFCPVKIIVITGVARKKTNQPTFVVVVAWSTSICYYFDMHSYSIYLSVSGENLLIHTFIYSKYRIIRDTQPCITLPTSKLTYKKSNSKLASQTYNYSPRFISLCFPTPSDCFRKVKLSSQ